MTDDDETRDFLRHLFGDPADRPPRDVIAMTGGLTRADLERQSANYGKRCQGVIPGEIIEGLDGDIIGMTESRSVASTYGGTFITKSQAEQFGIAEGDLPGIFIIDNPTTEEN